MVTLQEILGIIFRIYFLIFDHEGPNRETFSKGLM